MNTCVICLRKWGTICLKIISFRALINNSPVEKSNIFAKEGQYTFLFGTKFIFTSEIILERNYEEKSRDYYWLVKNNDMGDGNADIKKLVADSIEFCEEALILS